MMGITILTVPRPPVSPGYAPGPGWVAGTWDHLPSPRRHQRELRREVSKQSADFTTS